MSIHPPPGSLGVTLTLGALAVSFLGIRVMVRSTSESYQFENSPGEYEPFMRRYMQLAELVTKLAAGTVTLLASAELLGRASKVSWRLVSPMVLFAASIVLGVLFVAFLSFHYEAVAGGLLRYRRAHYVFQATLGFSALFCFCAGYVVLAFSILA